MSAARVTILLDPDTPLDRGAYVSETEGPQAGVYVGHAYGVAVWGSPAAMRRFAAAVVIAAEAGEQQNGEPQRTPAAASEAA